MKHRPTNNKSSELAVERHPFAGWFSGQTLLLAAVIAVCVGVVVFLVVNRSQTAGVQSGSAHAAQNPFDGESSYAYLKQICSLGPRPSGSAAMAAQQRFIIDHFQRLGAEVVEQPFNVRHPEKGTLVTMKNLIVQWHPDRKERILICTHYDTRPYPDQDPDPRRRKGVFIGANDGGSGVALLCELGKHMPGLESRYGVDFVFFDGEEFIFDQYRDKDLYFLGSKFFSKTYAVDPPSYQYKMGVLLDMVGDRELHLYQERYSLRYARSLVKDIWETADRLGVDEFVSRPRHEIRDDHLPLNQIAKIPSIDIIDFDFPRPGARPQYWHTEQDTVDACSGESLAKVGWVLLEWLKQVE